MGEVRTLSALKIVPTSYETYLKMPKPGRFPLNLPAINRHFLVYDPQLPNGPWGLFDEHDFRRFYTFTEKPAFDKMTPIERIPNEEDPEETPVTV